MHPDLPEPPRPLSESYWVLPGKFLAGEYPGVQNKSRTRYRIGALLQAGLDTFIDLTHPGELEPYEHILLDEAKIYGIQTVYYRFPTGDYGLPTTEQMRLTLGTIDNAIREGRKIYLHCWGGIGRTGTTVGCYLVHQGMSGKQALRQLDKWWQAVPKSIHFKRSPETDAQVEFILDWKD